MGSRWISFSILAGLALFPIVLQSGIASLKTYVSGNPPLPPRKQPRTIGDFAFEDSRGNPVNLGDMKGHHVLLNVWATWCPPCRKEMPALGRPKPILERDSDVTVVALSVDRVGFEQLQAFYDTYGLKNLGLFRGDEQFVLDARSVSGLPTTILVDHQGEEIARLIGPTEWDAPDVVANLKAIHAQK